MKTVDLKYMPGDECYIRGEDRTCYIENISIRRDSNGNLDITYEWCNYEYGVDCTEVWADGYFTPADIGVKVFDSMEELEKAWPEHYDYRYEE